MTLPAKNESAVIALVAGELRRNDECGPGPVSEQEYVDDATAILRIIRTHDGAEPSDRLMRPGYDMDAEPLLRGLLTRDDLRRGVKADIEVALDDVERLREKLARASAREAKWLQAFNSLEKPVTTHIERCIDADDLDRAHGAVMRKFGPNG